MEYLRSTSRDQRHQVLDLCLKQEKDVYNCEQLMIEVCKRYERTDKVGIIVNEILDYQSMKEDDSGTFVLLEGGKPVLKLIIKNVYYDCKTIEIEEYFKCLKEKSNVYSWFMNIFDLKNYV